MPRLFDDPRHRYTYTVLMSATMATVLTAFINVLDYGISRAAWDSMVFHWPFSFAVNLVASNLVSSPLRRLTVRLWAAKKRRK